MTTEITREQIDHIGLNFEVEVEEFSKLPALIYEGIRSFGLDPAVFRVSMTANNLHTVKTLAGDTFHRGWRVDVSAYRTNDG